MRRNETRFDNEVRQPHSRRGLRRAWDATGRTLRRAKAEGLSFNEAFSEVVTREWDDEIATDLRNGSL
jgi:hypothetical protein